MTITLKVSDLSAEDHRALEHLLGHSLREGEQVEIKVETPVGVAGEVKNNRPADLPAEYRVFEDLSEAEFADMKASILRPVRFGDLDE